MYRKTPKFMKKSDEPITFLSPLLGNSPGYFCRDCRSEHPYLSGIEFVFL